MKNRFTPGFIGFGLTGAALTVLSHLIDGMASEVLKWGGLAAYLIAFVVLVRASRGRPWSWSRLTLAVVDIAAWIVFVVGVVARDVEHGPWWSYVMIVGGFLVGGGLLSWTIQRDEDRPET